MERRSSSDSDNTVSFPMSDLVSVFRLLRTLRDIDPIRDERSSRLSSRMFASLSMGSEQTFFELHLLSLLRVDESIDGFSAYSHAWIVRIFNLKHSSDDIGTPSLLRPEIFNDVLEYSGIFEWGSPSCLAPAIEILRIRSSGTIDVVFLLFFFEIVLRFGVHRRIPLDLPGDGRGCSSEFFCYPVRFHSFGKTISDNFSFF